MNQAKDGDTTPRTREEALATNLYQSLDRVMSAVGVGRSTATPPLRHARLLLAAEHPLGDEIMDLTRRYLDARFGDTPLSASERRNFETRVRKMKDAPRVPLEVPDTEIEEEQEPAKVPEPVPVDEADVEITTAPPPPESDEGELPDSIPPDSIPPSAP
jgi:hypothetical protein